MKAIDVLIEDLETNTDWFVSHSKCCLENKRNNIRVWIANVPVLNTNVYEPSKLSLTISEKYRLYQATKVALNNAVLNALKDNNGRS